MNQSERNLIFDALKFICAFLVVTIHVHSHFREIAKPIDKCAVPLFFMISGFFLYTSHDLGSRLLRSIKKVSKIFLGVLVLFSLIFPIVQMCGIEQPLKWIDLPVFIVTNEVPIAYHLWYLPAFLYVLGITYYAHKWNKLNFMFAISFILFGIYLLATYTLMFVFDYTVPFPFLRNFLFVGIPFFYMGMYLKKHEDKFTGIPTMKLYFMALSALLLSFIEWKITSSHGAYFPYYLGTILFTLTVYVFCMNNSIKNQNMLTKLGQEYALYIYLLHPIVRYPFTYYERYASQTLVELYFYTSPILITLLTIGVIYLLKNKLKIKL